MTVKHILFTWPWSQSVMSLEGASLVQNTTADGSPIKGMESAYMVPEKALLRHISDEHVLHSSENAEGAFIRVGFPDSEAHSGDKGVLYDYDGNAYVPIND